jgi:hypothetical protein
LRADARPPFRPAAFFCAVVPPCDELERDLLLPPRLDDPGEFAIRAARSFDIPLSLSASYCFSFFTLARLPGMCPPFKRVASRDFSVETEERPTEVKRMPPRGVKKGTKRARQYEHIKDSARSSGASTKRAKEIAARTVQKERARSGESRERSRTSTRDMSSSRRGGLRSGTNRAKGRTYDQLYNEAKKMNVPGRSSMSKAQLQRAVDARKR